MQICSKEHCNGCHACVNVCPRACIQMMMDKEGFWYPKIDNKACIGCHRCETVCPIFHATHQITGDRKPKAYAAYNTREEIRNISSSGGIFTLLAETILHNGGVVFGAAFAEDFSVQHICVETIEELDQLRGSKYLQSRIGNTYRQAKQFLDQGRVVLFTGTPCQIGGLLSYLGKQYDNLFTQDLICHGVPSPMVWQRYVKFREKKAVSQTRRTFFRHKKCGWKMFSVQFEFTNCTEYIQVHSADLYMTSFLRNWCLRPSCYNCHFKELNRLSDITLADFWGIQEVAPEMDDDKGTSLVIIHSEKGKNLWNAIKESAEYKEVDIISALRENLSMTESVQLPLERSRFMRDIRYKRFDKCVMKYTKNTKSKEKKKTFRQWIRCVKRSSIVQKIKRMVIS